MAHTAPLKNKSGVVYGYQVKVYRGRDANGKQLKPFSTVWRIPEGMTAARRSASHTAETPVKNTLFVRSVDYREEHSHAESRHGPTPTPKGGK